MRLIKNIFIICILIYPLLLFIPDELYYINWIWGISLIIIFIIQNLVQTNLNIGITKLNIFGKTGLLLLLISWLSVVLNGYISFNFYWMSLKYSIALIIVSIFYDFFQISDTLKRNIFFISVTYLIIFLYVIFNRLSIYGFNFDLFIKERNEIWLEKPVIFAFMYASLYYLFVYFAYQRKKYKYLKYILSIPLFIMGARSVFMGIVVSMLIFFLNDFFYINKRKLVFGIITSSILSVLSFNYIFSYITENDTAIKLVGSERNQNFEDEIDIESFSSGRTKIISIYFEDFEIKHLLQGLGSVNARIGLSTHNDFLDFFFIYGLVALIIYVRYFIFGIILKLFKLKHLDRGLQNFAISLSIFILLQSLFNPFLGSLTSIFFLIIIILLFKENTLNANKERNI